ncbi:MAG: intradiol ring-cleavage dioxygenase [Proteobacteria bacterium]|nr:intradiol ring-cleavage dioxygenase [Pseudomonadota bacterium]
MKDFTLENLTDAVVEAYTTNAASPRQAQIIGSLVRHLHAFAKDVELTEAEWFEGIQFLTATGKKCDDKRQEFILLSDTLGLSMVVDAINHPKGGLGTESTVLGPFYVEGSPIVESGANIIKRDIGGEVVLVTGKVTDAAGKPLAGATLEVWQTANNQLYDVQDPDAPEWNLRATIKAKDDGAFSFVSEKPTSYPVPTDGPVGQLLAAGGRHAFRPAHLHFMVKAPGHETLTTHIFADGDPYLDSDAVFATKAALVAKFELSEDATLAAKYGLKVPFTTMHYEFGLTAQ